MKLLPKSSSRQLRGRTEAEPPLLFRISGKTGPLFARAPGVVLGVTAGRGPDDSSPAEARRGPGGGSREREDA